MRALGGGISRGMERTDAVDAEADFEPFDCGWSLLNHGVADTKRLNLGNLNPIYERELTKLELHQGEGRWSVSKNGARGRGCRHK